ncbi:MAG: hypothetical protein Kow0047_20850 [Anaerolineae bacterium]
MRIRHRYTALLLVMAILLLMTMPVAANGTKQVGLVIRYSDGTVHTEIVTVPSDATTFDVLLAANIDLVWSDTGFGPAVCKIGADGCPADSCFCDPAHFWGYWHLVGEEWVAADTGVGGYVPPDGSVEGFAWTGFDETFNPTTQPPVYTFDEILAMQQAPVQIPEPTTVVLLGSGIVALAGYARRRSRR